MTTTRKLTWLVLAILIFISSILTKNYFMDLFNQFSTFKTTLSIEKNIIAYYFFHYLIVSIATVVDSASALCGYTIEWAFFKIDFSRLSKVLAYKEGSDSWKDKDAYEDTTSFLTFSAFNEKKLHWFPLLILYLFAILNPLRWIISLIWIFSHLIGLIFMYGAHYRRLLIKYINLNY